MLSPRKRGGGLYRGYLPRKDYELLWCSCGQGLISHQILLSVQSGREIVFHCCSRKILSLPQTILAPLQTEAEARTGEEESQKPTIAWSPLMLLVLLSVKKGGILKEILTPPLRCMERGPGRIAQHKPQQNSKKGCHCFPMPLPKRSLNGGLSC